jgi:hypothetical protein
MLVAGLAPYDLLDCRVHFALLQRVGRAQMPARRSYLWRLLRRCVGRRVAIVNVTLAGVEEIQRREQISPALNHCRFEAATIVAAHVYTADEPRKLPSAFAGAKLFLGGKQVGTVDGGLEVSGGTVRAELAGTVYGADTITELVRLATPLAAGEFVALGFGLPEGWFLPTKQLPRA